jgi:SAM-dependent methyltransferase
MKPPSPNDENAFRDHFPEEVLEDLEDLPNYNDWIVSQFEPFLGGRTAEIGAGLGTISGRLLSRVQSLDLVEPAPVMAAQLQEKFDGLEHVRIFGETLENWQQAAASGAYDGIVLVNVLEHIKDDHAAARGFFQSLKAGGHLMIFVPAMPFLYSKLDYAYGHYRRYTLQTLEECIATAGFKIEKLHFVDLAGVFPWWLLNTVLGKTSFHGPSLRVYDRVVVPVTRKLESVLRPPLGKNLILIARKETG